MTTTYVSTSTGRFSGRLLLAVCIAALGGFLFGFDSAIINGGVDAIQQAFDLSPGLLGFTVSCALLGAALGAWYAGVFAERVGRVRTMLIAAGMLAVGAIGSAFSFSVWDLILWRFIGGIGVGFASVIAPAYIAEVAPAHLRGRLGTLQQLALVTGIFLALLVGAAIAGFAGGASERDVAGPGSLAMDAALRTAALRGVRGARAAVAGIAALSG